MDWAIINAINSGVNITVTGVPTTIESISIPTNIKEGQPIQLSASAITAANNTPII